MTSPTEPIEPVEPTRRAQVWGTGLIGGSIGLALRQRGWHVTGHDASDETEQRALALGALDGRGVDDAAAICFIAAPVSQIAPAAQAFRQRNPDAVITDVGSVKAPVVAAVGDRRFVGGHPMAGSEQEGLGGADPELFAGATWVLTPVESTDSAAFMLVREVVTSLGAQVLALPPERHDALVAVVSHVPHLTAASLMGIAADEAEESSALLRLAAGGFRDMTRIAAGHPGIWPDICTENRDAIVDVLGRLIDVLTNVRDVVADADRDELLRVLERARAARVSLPSRAVQAEHLTELRVPVPDRPGVIAEVSTLAGELAVNIYDLEIAHSAEGDRGVLVMVVDAGMADVLRQALAGRGFRVSAAALGS
jgi:prephenate dehydrogenase